MQRQMELWPTHPHRPEGYQAWTRLDPRSQREVIAALGKAIVKCVQMKMSPSTQEDTNE